MDIKLIHFQHLDNNMTINFKNSIQNVYFVFYNSDIDINSFIQQNEDRVFVNLNIQNSIMANSYFRKNKLKFNSDLLESFSDAPQEIFSTVVHLLKKNRNIFVGTAGISYESIADIYFELKYMLKNTENKVFICHQKKTKKGIYELVEKDFLNKNDIMSLFLTVPL